MNDPPINSDDADRAELLHALENAFSQSYLTLISIIQAGILGFLIFVIDRATDQGTHPSKISPANWILAATSFCIAVATWNEYLMGVTIFNWIPTLIDALIPFGVGTTEFLMILSIERGIRWGLISSGLFYLIAFLGMENMFRRAVSSERNKFALSIIRPYRIANSITCLAAALTFLIIGLYSSEYSFSPGAKVWVASIILVTIVFHLIREWCYWNRLICRACRNGDAVPPCETSPLPATRQSSNVAAIARDIVPPPAASKRSPHITRGRSKHR